MKTPTRIGWDELFSRYPERDLRTLHTSVRPAYGHMTHTESAILLHLVAESNASHVFEFGTFDGLTALNLARMGCKVTTLDYGKCESYLTSDGASYHSEAGKTCVSRWNSHGVSKNISRIDCDSALFDASPLAGQFDVVIIDGNHSLEYVASDTAKAFLLCREGGLIIWHDYYKRMFPAVTAHVSALAELLDIVWIDDRDDGLQTSLCFCVKK